MSSSHSYMIRMRQLLCLLVRANLSFIFRVRYLLMFARYRPHAKQYSLFYILGSEIKTFILYEKLNKVKCMRAGAAT